MVKGAQKGGEARPILAANLEACFPFSSENSEKVDKYLEVWYCDREVYAGKRLTDCSPEEVGATRSSQVWYARGQRMNEPTYFSDGVSRRTVG